MKMGWFGRRYSDEDEAYDRGRVRRSYDSASGYVQQSPTIVTAILTLLWCIVAVLSKQESLGTVAGPGLTALLFLAHNIHIRKANKETHQTLEEVRDMRSRIEDTKRELNVNTSQTVTAAASATQAAASVARVEDLTQKIDEKVDAALRAKEAK
jgi:hypothetical protein